MNRATAVTNDRQLVRILQVGVVLEELIEARVFEHYRELAAKADALDDNIEALLLEAYEESSVHRERLEALIDDLGARSVPYGEIERLVQKRYGGSKPATIDGVLADQLAAEESAFNYYDSVITAIEAGDAAFSIDHDRLLSTLREIRAEEAEGVTDVRDCIERL